MYIKSRHKSTFLHNSNPSTNFKLFMKETRDYPEAEE